MGCRGAADLSVDNWLLLYVLVYMEGGNGTCKPPFKCLLFNGGAHKLSPVSLPKSIFNLHQLLFPTLLFNYHCDCQPPMPTTHIATNPEATMETMQDPNQVHNIIQHHQGHLHKG